MVGGIDLNVVVIISLWLYADHHNFEETVLLYNLYFVLFFNPCITKHFVVNGNLSQRYYDHRDTYTCSAGRILDIRSPNVEYWAFLALICPFYHQSSVIK